MFKWFWTIFSLGAPEPYQTITIKITSLNTNLKAQCVPKKSRVQNVHNVTSNNSQKFKNDKNISSPLYENGKEGEPA